MSPNVFSTPEYTSTRLLSESYSTHPVLAISRAKKICLSMEKTTITASTPPPPTSYR